MPSLQDLLEDFDASRLEELAESLLADVTTDMEDDTTRGSNAFTKTESDSKRLFGSMVGTKTEDLEPCQDINGSLSTPTKRPKYIKEEPFDCVLSQEPILPPAHLSAEATMAPSSPLDSAQKLTNKSMSLVKQIDRNNIDETLYGTYDEENNCITIVLPDEDISNFEEVIEEVHCNDEDDEYLSQVSILSPIPTNYPSPGYSSYCGNSNDIKSPASSSDRDSAYDSLMGSPPGASITSSHTDYEDEYHYSELWPDSFSELFPSLA